MATYTKPLKTIVITLMTGASGGTYTDTATNPVASNALAEFEAYKTMHIKNTDGSVTMIPFHAVAMIKVTAASSEVTKADPYGCETEEEENQIPSE